VLQQPLRLVQPALHAHPVSHRAPFHFSLRSCSRCSISGLGTVSIHPSPADWQPMVVHPIEDRDRDWMEITLRSSWGSTAIARRAELLDVSKLSGFVARLDDAAAGLLTYLVDDEQLEIETINSLRRGTGVGRALVEAAKELALSSGCKTIVAITTNDNVNALAFYQKVGFRIRDVFRDSVQEIRQLKPSLPDTGQHGIPIRDEIQLELSLTSD